MYGSGISKITAFLDGVVIPLVALPNLYTSAVPLKHNLLTSGPPGGLNSQELFYEMLPIEKKNKQTKLRYIKHLIEIKNYPLKNIFLTDKRFYWVL